MREVFIEPANRVSGGVFAVLTTVLAVLIHVIGVDLTHATPSPAAITQATAIAALAVRLVLGRTGGSCGAPG